MPKITVTRLKEIISEEISNASDPSKNEDFEAAAKVMSSAAKLLSAMQTFKESSTGTALAAISSHADGLEAVLKQIAASPMQYVDSQKPVVKKVSLKPTGKVM